jgi:hypothetical protein
MALANSGQDYSTVFQTNAIEMRRSNLGNCYSLFTNAGLILVPERGLEPPRPCDH